VDGQIYIFIPVILASTAAAAIITIIMRTVRITHKCIGHCDNMRYIIIVIIVKRALAAGTNQLPSRKTGQKLNKTVRLGFNGF
jgi:hypothetical protein